MKTNSIIIDISPPILYLAIFWFSGYWPKCCQPVKLQGYLKCNILKKDWMMKYIFGMLVNIKAQSTQNKKFIYLCNISSKTWGMKLIFCMQINVKVFYKIIVSLWVWVARHAQSTQNRNFAISLQYIVENVKDEIGFLPADQRQKFL